MADKLNITCALTGAITVPAQNPNLSFTPQQLIAGAEAAAKAGASAVHVHARAPKIGRPSSDPDLFAPVLAGIHAKTDAVVGQLATHVELVEKVVRIANEFDREIATPADMRALLGLRGKENVTFPKVEETVA